MRIVNQEAIERHGAERFRSEFHYARFEYWRSAKVLRYLANAGITDLGRVLDDGCGGGGMSVSFAEESELAVAIDLEDRFMDAGTRLVAEQGGPGPQTGWAYVSRNGALSVAERSSPSAVTVPNSAASDARTPARFSTELVARTPRTGNFP